MKMEQEKDKSSTDPQQETFSQMAAVTTKSGGVVGKLLVISLIVVSLAVTAFVGFAVLRGVNGENYVDKDKYQAVFLSDGQTYYGKISSLDGSYIKLSDVYYLQVVQGVQTQKANAKDTPDDEIKLIKLGEEKHCPVDEMHINRDQVLFWENIRTDGQVVKAIEAFLEQNEGSDEVVCSVPAATDEEPETEEENS